MHCQWGGWEAWSSCGTTCSAADGTGDQTRTRPSTGGTNGGTVCNAADGSDTQSCSIECPGNRIIWFCNLVTKLCIFQWIANGEAGKHGRAVEQPAVQPMVQEIKSGQELVQQLQMAGHAMQLMGVKPSLAVLNARVRKLGGHNNI